MGHHFRDKPWTEDELPLSVRRNMEQIFDRLQELNRPAKELANALEKAGVFKEIQTIADFAKQQEEQMRAWKRAFISPRFHTNVKAILTQKIKHVPQTVYQEDNTDEIVEMVYQKLQASMGIIKIDGDVTAELIIDHGVIFRHPKELLSFKLTENRLTILKALKYELQKTAFLADNLHKSKDAIRQAINEMDDSIVRNLHLPESVIFGDQVRAGYFLNPKYKFTFINPS